MKNLRVLSVLFYAVLAATGWAQPTNPIQRLTLDATTVVRIPVALDRLTTVRLPGPPSDVESARVGTEPHPEALFLLSIQPASPTFSVRALVPHTNTTLNVTWKGQTYVLDLFESPHPWLSVTFEAPREPAPRTANSPTRGVAPARLLGLLDTAKAYGLLRQQHPAAVAGIEVVRPNTLRNYGTYTIRTEEVMRWDAEDTLVFRIAISNQTGTVLQYVPESLMVRAGTQVYYQSIAEATGSVPPHATVPVYFAVTGSPDGSRNALSPKNDFMILLHRIESVAKAEGPPPGAQSLVVPPPAAPPANPAAAAPRQPLSLAQFTVPVASPPPPVAPPPTPARALTWQTPTPAPPTPARARTPSPHERPAALAGLNREVSLRGGSRAQPLRSQRACEEKEGGIGFRFHIGFGAR
jgi:hypothetical protein